MKRDIVQPALIIGAGGSGIEVVRRFKRRFDEVYPDVPYVQVLGIDTAPQEELGRHAPLLDGDEFLYAADFNMDFFVGRDAIDNHPEIRHWWRGYDRLPLKTVKSGAGQKRPVGRLALFVNYDDIVQRLRAQVTKLFRSDVFENLPNEYRKSVNLYIISSTCGGTGTGQFLDLAFAARDAIGTVRPGISVNPRGLFFLPSAFLETDRVAPQNGPRLQANAYGALTELDYVMNPEVEAPDVSYPGNHDVSWEDPPFRSVYLVGNQTTAGKLLTDFEELMERAAVHLMIELASPLSETGDARMDNVLSAIAAKGTVKGRGRSYSAFGEEWLELPTARLRVRWQKQLATRLIDRLIGDESSAATSKTSLDDSGSFGLLRSLWRADGLKAYLPNVHREREIFLDIGEEGLPEADILGNANTLETAAQRQLAAVESQVSERLSTAARELPDEIYSKVLEQIQKRDIDSGVRLLSDIEETLSEWIARGRKEGVRDTAGHWVEALGARLSELKPGLLQSKKNYSRAQRDIVLEASQSAREEWTDQLRQYVGAAADRELPGVHHHVRELRQRLERIAQYLTAARALVQQEPEPTPPAGTRVQALSDVEIEEAYNEDGRPKRLEATANDQLHALLEIAPVTVEGLKDAIWSAAGYAVRQLAGEYLQDVSIPNEEVADRLKELQPLAVFDPAWHAEPAQRDVQRLRILGLPEASMERKEEILSLLPDATRRETEPVSHADPDRVVMTVQDHGFPLFALDEVKRLRREYDALDPAEKSMCFVLPGDASRSWSLLPLPPHEAKQRFGLAFPLNMIKQVGAKYVFNAGGPRDIDIPLGEGADMDSRLETAFNHFLSGGYASDVDRQLASEERKDTPGLYRRLTKWIEDQRRKQTEQAAYPEFFREIVDLVEEYCRSINPF